MKEVSQKSAVFKPLVETIFYKNVYKTLWIIRQYEDLLKPGISKMVQVLTLGLQQNFGNKLDEL